jgi:hypothetical protein
VTAPAGMPLLGAAPADVGRLRCAAVSRLVGDDLVGSTPARDHVFVEAPAPWPRDWRAAGGYPGGMREALARLAGEHGVEVKDHLILPESPPAPGRVRFLAYLLPAGPAARLDRHEYLVPPDQLAGLATALLGPGGDLRPYAAYRVGGGAVRDFFVCTHGSRDACCGRLGVPVYQALRWHAGMSSGRLRVWRTSHIGGHRFAPTLVELPTGRYWGHLDGGLAETLVTRTAPPAALAAAYRGRMLVAPLAQAVERRLFLRHGWAWDEVPIEATIEVGGRRYGDRGQPAEAVGSALVRLHHGRPADGPPRQVTARVVADGTITTAGCGKLIATVPRYRVVDTEPSYPEPWHSL